MAPCAYWVDACDAPGAPWLVFLPGLTADHTLFDAQMSYFSGRANCLVWDAPTHGASRPYPLCFSMDDCARILHGIVQRAGAERPVLVGQSLGGYVAQVFLCLFPGEAAGFVSLDSAPLKRTYYPAWEVRALRHTKGMYLAVPWALLKPRQLPAVRRQLRARLCLSSIPVTPEGTRARHAGARPHLHAGRFGRFPNPCRSRLGRSSRASLLSHGRLLALRPRLLRTFHGAPVIHVPTLYR